ncbi:MAG: hypothetical protein HC916_04395 [Coleofasciculaceae cyanobacterium SM2_1_6]|nr:hypothetical protein [Coleofasciculaceae cyanobacterium SM2_1_6]
MSESSSESSSGVYKSRLFNFINRRSQQLVDQSKTVLRHLQVATVWSVQIALYPVYLLVQTTQTFVRQIQQSATKNQTQLSESEIAQPTLPPAPDQIVKNILNSVESFLKPAEISSLIAVLSFRNLAASPKLGSNHQTQILELASDHLDHVSDSINNSKNDFVSIGDFSDFPDLQSTLTTIPHPEIIDQHSLRHSLITIAKESNLATKDISIQQESIGKFIQGVACSSESKALVLVDNHNRILDILTPVQQQKLAKKIIWEIANYYYDRRQFLQSQRPIPNQLPQPTSPKVFLPARWFWKLMAWVQQGDVAIAADLFQESRLTNPNQNLLKLPSFSLPSLAIDPETLSNFDEQIYQVEENQIVPTSQWLIHVGEEIFPMIIHPENLITKGLANRHSRQSLTNSNSDPRELINGNQSPKINSSDTNSQDNIWQLIQAAIVYFFGKKPVNLNPDTQSSSISNNSPVSASPSLDNSAASVTYPELLFSEDDWLNTEDLFVTTSLSKVNSYQDEMMLDVPSLAENQANAKIETKAETKMLAQTNSPSWTQVMVARFKKVKPQQHKISHQSSRKSLSNSPNKSSDLAATPQRTLPPTKPLPSVHGSPQRQNYRQQKSAQKSTQKSIQRSNPAALDRSQSISQKSPQLVKKTIENSSLTNNSPDWIETEVTSKGYVKHPLQKSIEILDEIVLWIEKLFSWFWNLIKVKSKR